MGYSNYKKIKSVVKKFNLDMRTVNLFSDRNVFYIDTKTFTNLAEILGVWHYVLQLYL